MASPHLLLVCLDSVRKDYADEYLPRVQDVAIGFSQCRAASSWSLPSHASMFTGDLPHKHGVHVYNKDFEPTVDRTFLSALSELGYGTFAYSANFVAGEAFGFDALFDEFAPLSSRYPDPDGMDVEQYVKNNDVEGIRKYLDALYRIATHPNRISSLKNAVSAQLHHGTQRGPVPKLVDAGAGTIAEHTRERLSNSDGPQFGFLNFMEAHVPLQHTIKLDRELHSAPYSWSSDKYEKAELHGSGDNEEYWRLREEVYGATIDYLDRVLADLLESLATLDRETTVVVTADHGENHGNPAEDNLVSHNSSLSEALLHVPLYVINPPEAYPGDPDRYVSHLDLPELVVSLADGAFPDVGRDRVPAELVGGTGSKPDDVPERVWNRTIRCVYEGDRKWEWDSLGRTREFELERSRPSHQGLVEEGGPVPEWRSEFFDISIEEYRDAVASSTDDVDAATQDRLRELGYV